ncbi:L-threonylcarbamoyladenylate synthase [Halalkalibacterium ligniniphilum]|uniref:L-threonylcarbamoyladenylate synthase n=1 Tax=Halalkalibacterium ligniniphilum TaxID=1134413 RepID=UPI0003461E04|nr:L-threonylcarbamoyladenylate synthase [Halalkalibacterium ligniniphilum]
MSYKQTRVWIVDKNKEIDKNVECIKEAGLWIKNNEVVALPTETVYGLGANARSNKAVAKIFEAKGRPSDNPLIVHIAKIEQLNKIVKEIPETARKLMEAFWPGPLTIIFQNAGQVAEKVTAGLPTVAIRMPDHPVALALLEAADVPVAAPSANLSGKPSPTTAQHVLADLNGRIAGIVDGGPTGVGLESTVIDCTVHPPMIYRPGGVTKEEIEAVIGEVCLDQALVGGSEVPKSPGLKYTHYAPEGDLVLVEDVHIIQALVNEEKKKGKKVGVLTTEERKGRYEADVVLTCGRRQKLATVATQLYSVLRQFDATNVDVIFSETFPKEGVGEAVMNRLEKAAGGRVIRRDA